MGFLFCFVLFLTQGGICSILQDYTNPRFQCGWSVRMEVQTVEPQVAAASGPFDGDVWAAPKAPFPALVSENCSMCHRGVWLPSLNKTGQIRETPLVPRVATAVSLEKSAGPWEALQGTEAATEVSRRARGLRKQSSSRRSAWEIKGPVFSSVPLSTAIRYHLTPVGMIFFLNKDDICW